MSTISFIDNGMNAPTTPALEVNAQNLISYLRERPEYSSEPDLRTRELGGGVSNGVFLAETSRERFVVKQALSRLRVKDEWLADRSRIFRERDALVDSAKLLPRGWVPQVLWSDEPNFLFAMQAADQPVEFWKQRLLAGVIEPDFARSAGIALGLTIRGTWKSESFAQKFGDRTAFDQLRTDPYYREIARRNPDIAADVNAWIGQTANNRFAFTHGDWSPKNMLVTPSGMVFIDYECAHFGDPSFDAGFGINHLILKAFHRPEQAADYLELARIFFATTTSLLPDDALSYFEAATMRHLGLLMLARVDGKSPVEYLEEGGAGRDQVRGTAKQIISARPERLEDCLRIALGAIKG